MIKMLIMIAETVVVINIVYVLLPNGTFEKYSKYVFGLILMLIFAGSVTKTELSSEILGFEESIPTFNQELIENTVTAQMKKVLENNLAETLESEGIKVNDIVVTLTDNTIKCVEVAAPDNYETDEIIRSITECSGLDDSIVVIK